ncbi:MAG: hypothetical protein GY731_02615, partial [Gammaproteobacteria bacterium]|nr:hypothetical protein [Gammaproteobacteria bacterium]
MQRYTIDYSAICGSILLGSKEDIKRSLALFSAARFRFRSFKTCFRRAYLSYFIIPLFSISVAATAVPLANDDTATIDEDSVLTEAAPGVLGNDSSGLEVDTSFTLNYDAATEVAPSDAMWEDETGQTGGKRGSNYDLTLTGETLLTSPTTSFSGITQSYNFQGNLGGGSGGSMDSLQDLAENPSNDDASFELWFRPDDLQDADVLFETGATGDGVSLIIVDDDDGEFDDLHFVVKDSKRIVTLIADLSGILGGSGNVTNEFIQVVATYDKNKTGSTDVVSLYINGSLVAQDAGQTALNDWAGSNDTGIGTVNGNINVGKNVVTDYEGDIAIFRFYETTLSETTIADNFDSIVGANLTVSSVSDGGAVGSPFALPSGALVTLNADGSYDYNASGQFDHLVDNETTADNFTYAISNNGGPESGPATVTIVISGVNDAPIANPDSGTVNEGGVVDIDLAVNDDDADDGLNPDSILITGAATNGDVVVNGDGTVSYSHDGGETTIDSFSYTIKDLSGAVSNVATVSI